MDGCRGQGSDLFLKVEQGLIDLLLGCPKALPAPLWTAPWSISGVAARGELLACDVQLGASSSPQARPLAVACCAGQAGPSVQCALEADLGSGRPVLPP